MVSVHSSPHDALPVPFEEAVVRDAMSRGVISCPPETPLRVVARMMATFGIHAVYVFEHQDEDDEAPRLWALVSDLDLVAAATLDLERRTAGQTASSPALTVSADESLERVAQLMTENETAHVIVTGPEGLPAGVVSTLDVARALGGD
jgi:CBS domain-containing protein